MNQSSLFGPTLQESRLEFLAALDDGVICPCCGRYAQRYKRWITSAMARAMIWMYRRHRQEWFNLEKTLRAVGQRSGDPAKLRHWELLEKSPKENRGSAGTYRLTAKGCRFLLGQIQVQRNCYVLFGKPEYFSDDSTNIREALADDFDYDELMRS